MINRKTSALALAGLLCLGALLFAEADNQAARRFGLFVGANDGGPEREKLQWAISDAQRMNQVMSELGGLLPGDSQVMTEPKLADLQQALARMRLQVANAAGDARRVEFIFYYSGHSDEDGLLIGKDRLPYKALRQAITDVKADVTIAVLDSCASGAFTRQKGGVRVQPFLVDTSNDMKGYAFLTSASENEAAQESDRLGASFFTHYLVSALRGAAATNGNGRVTLNEAYRYAFDETLARTEATTSGPQHASYDINLSGTGDLVLSDLSQPSASILLKEDLEGRVFIRDIKGYLVVEVNKTMGKSSVLALQPGNYTLRIESPNGVFQAPARLSLRQQYAIGMANFQRTEVVSNRTRGNAPASDLPPAAAGAVAAAEATQVLPDAAALGMDNVLEQARARYRRAQLDETPTTPVVPAAPAAQERPADATDELPPPDAADMAASDAADDSNDLQASVLVDLEGIGIWQVVTPEAKPAKPVRVREPAVTTDPTRVFFHVGFVPGLGTVRGRNIISTFTISPFIASVAGNNGIMASLLINLNSGREQGWQASALINSTGDLQGIQTSAIGNITARDSTGVQLAAIFGISQAKFEGWQAAALFNINQGGFGGLQSAGLFNIGSKGIDGVQAAGLFNIAGAASNAVQLAGFFNSARTFSGVQAAGLINVSTEAHGVVIAPINIMGKFDGLPIGVVNIVGDGIHDVSYWFDMGDRTWIGLLNGSKNFYSIFSAGTENLKDLTQLNGLAIALGVGGRYHFNKYVYLDVEGSLKRGSSGSSSDQRLASLFGNSNESAGRVNLVPSCRVNLGLDLGFIKGFIGTGADIFTAGLVSPENYVTQEGMKVLVNAVPGKFAFRPGLSIGLSLSF